MTLAEFIENLVELNDGANFPRELLRELFASINTNPLGCDMYVVCSM